MSRINVLDEKTANLIKAGEVIERPVSVVKELVDNSIDAGATSVKIEFENGGISLIRVSDNGIGMDLEDSRKCFLLHATSKIKNAEDIYNLSTQGFRGEALASIAACSEVTLITRQEDMEAGVIIEYDNGKFIRERESSADRGTVVQIKSLFSNMPARYKFLKRDATEAMYICSLVEKLAIINPQVSFRLVKDGKQILSTPGNGSMMDAIYAIYGRETASALTAVDYEQDGLKIKGYTGNPSFVRGNRGMQYIYVNDRPVKSAVVSSAIDEAYRASVMKHKYPVCILCIYVPSGEVDVNVHPQKAEVKFSDDSGIFRLVYHGIRNALTGAGSVENAVPVHDKQTSSETDNADGSHTISDSVLNLPSSVSHGPSRAMDNYTPSQSRATDNLLRILSGFKPDITVMENEDGEETPEILSASESHDASVRAKIRDLRDGEICDLLSSEFTGFLFATYIIMQSDEAVFLVDQHAAHERVLFERFGAQRNLPDNEKRHVESMLVPQIIDLSSADISFVSDNILQFRELGFDIDIAGDRQIALRSVPTATRSEDRLKAMSKPSVMFAQVLNDMKRENPGKSDVWISLIQTTACRTAIKAGDIITKEEALALLDMLGKCDDPYHCAHGRPTFYKVLKTQIEKNFKRIV